MFKFQMRLSKPFMWLSSFALFFTLSSLVLLPYTDTQAATFADPAFSQVWNKTDQAVATGALKASWLWGPDPRSSRTEAYQQTISGQRMVQYFDKSRMEITNPGGDRNSTWFVTNGLLCRELVSGQVQTGDARYESRTPATVPVGGDMDSPVGPTYATFNSFASLNADQRVDKKTGFVTDFIDREGQIGATTVFTEQVKYDAYDSTLGHNIPDVLIKWMNGLSSRGVSWQYVMGLPITEPYWAKFKVAGVEREVLVQLFERRALTFNPLNEAAWQVEMGNIGLHYWNWRYGNNMPAAPTTSNPSNLDNEEVAFLHLINQYRQANGKVPLALNQHLINAAEWMSLDMANKDYMDHTDSLGNNPITRIELFGYTANTYKGENLAAGYETAAKVLAGWQNSPGHNENMLNNNFRVIGIARAYNLNSSYRWYWTTDFGGR
ncbi:MAG: CAP domain-containing protein [Chloroflexota bacterium]|nr:CAP domain-containing protein [Chloroflexota bacterium]